MTRCNCGCVVLDEWYCRWCGLLWIWRRGHGWVAFRRSSAWDHLTTSTQTWAKAEPYEDTTTAA